MTSIRPFSTALLVILCAFGTAAAQPGPGGMLGTLVASDGEVSDDFGTSVSLSGDRALVGANQDIPGGSAYVFVLRDGVWTEEAKLLPDSDEPSIGFGSAVSLSGDRALVGAPIRRLGSPSDNEAGSAYVFVRQGSAWVLEARLVADDGATGDQFGGAVSLSGDRALVGALRDDDGAFFSGSAYVFVRTEGGWTQEAKLSAGTSVDFANFGATVSLADGQALIGAPEFDSSEPGFGAGSAYVFTRSGDAWSQEVRLTASDGAANELFGAAVSLAGDRLVIGAPFASADARGAAYVFVRTGAGWLQEAKLTDDDGGANQRLGSAVALSADRVLAGIRNLAGIENRDVVPLFERDGDAWTQQASLTFPKASPTDNVGRSLAFSDDPTSALALIGVPSSGGEGTAYVFDVDARPVTSAPAPSAGALTWSGPRPNPSASRAVVTLSVEAAQAVRVTVSDALGREVARLWDGELAGRAEFAVDTARLAPGVYLVRVQGEGVAETRRMAVVR